MFHAHESEFAELGWMGFFEVEDDAASPATRRPPARGPRLAAPAWFRWSLLAAPSRRSRRSTRPASSGRRPAGEELAVERTASSRA